MCGRYTTPEEDEISRFYDEWEGDHARRSYNVAPQTLQPIVTIHAGIKKGQLAKWGLLPKWAKDPKIAYKMINARSETAHEKPSYKTAFKYSRCLIPASGWYEWQATPAGKQPFYFRQENNSPFCFAGLRSTWTDENEKPVQTFSILTKEATNQLSEIHHRMPVVLPDHLHDSWLDPKLKNESVIQELMLQSIKEFYAFPVSTYVNSPRNNDEKCVLPYAQ